MKNLLLLFILAMMAFAACKDYEYDIYPINYPDYANLEPGNYWVYERYKLDSTGVYTPLGIFDSVFVEKDTVIGGFIFYKYMEDQFGTTPGYEAVFLRDSLHYLINSAGQLLFSSENFSDTLWDYTITILNGGSPTSIDTICDIFRKMTDDNLDVSVPAGTFSSKNAQLVYLMYPDFDYGGPVRKLERRYAENVGLIEETLPFFLADQSKSYTVRRLVRYGNN